MTQFFSGIIFVTGKYAMSHETNSKCMFFIKKKIFVKITFLKHGILCNSKIKTSSYKTDKCVWM